MFLTDLVVGPLRGSSLRRLVKDLVYIRPNGARIVVKKGFITDYASIPEIIPGWILDSDHYVVREPSIVHDFLYNSRKMDRKECDVIFYEGMKDLCKTRGDRIKAWLAYKAVRVWGWVYY